MQMSAPDCHDVESLDPKSPYIRMSVVDASGRSMSESCDCTYKSADEVLAALDALPGSAQVKAARKEVQAAVDKAVARLQSYTGDGGMANPAGGAGAPPSPPAPAEVKVTVTITFKPFTITITVSW